MLMILSDVNPLRVHKTGRRQGGRRDAVIVQSLPRRQQRSMTRSHLERRRNVKRDKKETVSNL